MLEKIVTDINVSKELKELGVDLVAHVMWVDYGRLMRNSDKAKVKPNYNLQWSPNTQSNDFADHVYAAYTLETLLDALPDEIEDQLGEYGLTMPLRDTFAYEEIVNGCTVGASYEVERKPNESLATTAGRLLIKLIKDKVITVEEVNK